jgi:hypothetical protein
VCPEFERGLRIFRYTIHFRSADDYQEHPAFSVAQRTFISARISQSATHSIGDNNHIINKESSIAGWVCTALMPRGRNLLTLKTSVSTFQNSFHRSQCVVFTCPIQPEDSKRILSDLFTFICIIELNTSADIQFWSLQRQWYIIPMHSKLEPLFLVTPETLM